MLSVLGPGSIHARFHLPANRQCAKSHVSLLINPSCVMQCFKRILLAVYAVENTCWIRKLRLSVSRGVQEKTSEGDGEPTSGKSFSEHWGWWGTIYNLSKSNILSISGERAITDLNLMMVLNYLEIDKDYNKELEKAQAKVQSFDEQLK